jgi:hypothetical protein
VDTVRNAEKEVFHLAGAEISVELAQRGNVAQGAAGSVQPRGGALAAPEHLLGQSRHSAQSKEPIGLVRVKALLLLSPGEGSRWQAKHNANVLRRDAELGRKRFERHVRQAAAQLFSEMLEGRRPVPENALASKGAGDVRCCDHIPSCYLARIITPNGIRGKPARIEATSL